jgi:hypothetical protein
VRLSGLLCLLAVAGFCEWSVVYRLEATRSLSRFSAAQLAVLAKLNRADLAHLGRLSRIIVPDRWDGAELDYSPMPRRLDSLSDERKAVIVDLAAQVFGAYESGELVRWGPVSSGDRHHTTPSGIYHLNWHQRVRISSENPTWIMPWYFNFSSERGFGLHEYALPGRPASHGCVRLLAADAQWMFRWGEGWGGYDPDTGEAARDGTLVLLVGTYDFAAAPPWLRPGWWAHGVSITPDRLRGRRRISPSVSAARPDSAQPVR